MSDAQSIAVLNRLLSIVGRSLPMYLTFAQPEPEPGSERIAAALEHIVADHQAIVARALEAIEARNGYPEYGGFPMEFTDTHMLSLRFLLRDLLRWQRFDITRIESLVDSTSDDRAARELILEALGSERAHLEALRELATPASPARPSTIPMG